MDIMAINRGIAPPDPSTPVGQLRGALGDTEYKELDPPEEGYGSYENFGDTELEALLAMSDGSPTRAAGYGYLKLAAQAANEAVDWASDDKRVTMSKRAEWLTKQAQIWFDLADSGDQSAVNNYFDLVYPFGNRYDEECGPEAAYRLVRRPWFNSL